MTDMIDRAAETIMIGATANSMFRPNWAGQPEDVKAFWRKITRDAIEVMREADDAMLRAGVNVVRREGEISDPLSGMVWRTMIDAALKPRSGRLAP